MRCPKCKCTDTAVINSRVRDNGTTRWRKHECKRCGFQFSTYEIDEPTFQYHAMLAAKDQKRKREIARRYDGK